MHPFVDIAFQSFNAGYLRLPPPDTSGYALPVLKVSAASLPFTTLNKGQGSMQRKRAGNCRRRGCHHLSCRPWNCHATALRMFRTTEVGDAECSRANKIRLTVLLGKLFAKFAVGVASPLLRAQRDYTATDIDPWEICTTVFLHAHIFFFFANKTPIQFFFLRATRQDF